MRNRRFLTKDQKELLTTKFQKAEQAGVQPDAPDVGSDDEDNLDIPHGLKTRANRLTAIIKNGVNHKAEDEREEQLHELDVNRASQSQTSTTDTNNPINNNTPENAQGGNASVSDTIKAVEQVAETTSSIPKPGALPKLIPNK